MPADIQHIIVLMMENRSFDHMFGYLNIADPAVPGDRLEGLVGSESNPFEDGTDIKVSSNAKYVGDYRADPGHHFADVLEQMYGTYPAPAGAVPAMSGFVSNYANHPDVRAIKKKALKRETAGRVMKCFRPDKIPALTTLAREFAVCDHWFSSLPGPTLPNRAFAHTGTSNGHVDMNPVAYWALDTIYERLDEAGRSSRVYSFDGNTLAFAFRKLFSGGRKYLGQFGDFLRDLKKDLPHYCFIEPRFSDAYDAANHRYFRATDQHPDNNVADGDLFIQEVFEAIRKSRYWERSLFVIVYDEHGGFYDHVPPPGDVPNPDGKNSPEGFDFTRLGVRVPAVVVSPFIPRGTILHEQFDHTSLVATARKLLAPRSAVLSERSAVAHTFDSALALDQPRKVPKALKDFEDCGRQLRESDVNPNTHGQGPLSDQQRSQVLAASEVDLTRPAGQRILGTTPFRTTEEINTEQRATEYIKRVHDSLMRSAQG